MTLLSTRVLLVGSTCAAPEAESHGVSGCNRIPQAGCGVAEVITRREKELKLLVGIRESVVVVEVR